MKLGEIWSYFRHRKGLLLLILGISATVGALGCKILSSPKAVQTATMQAVEAPANTYDNSLSLKIFGESNETALQLTFSDAFKKATLTMTDAALPTDSYVRVFDQFGNLLAGEYTEINDIGDAESQPVYHFRDAPKAYTLFLAPGAKIEVHAQKARFYSNLTKNEAGYFAPTLEIERYVVMENGLRKESWSEETGEATMYAMLRVYLVDQIEQYKAQVAPEVLENKGLDMTNKARILVAYYALSPEDQAIYREFMDLVENGKQPEEPIPDEPSEDEPTEEDPGGQFVPTPIEPVEKPELTPEASITDQVATSEVATNVVVASLGAGANREEELVVTDTDGSETEDEAKNPAEEQLETDGETDENAKHDSGAATVHSDKRSADRTSTNTAETKPGFLKVVIWVVLGVLVVIVFGKFFLDHYVR